MERLFVVPRDVCKYTGKGERYAQQFLKDLRLLLGKGKHQLITKKELADYLGVDVSELKLSATPPGTTKV